MAISLLPMVCLVVKCLFIFYYFMYRFIKRETAMFFGLDEEFEETEKLKWLDRRKRLATRKYGELKNEYICSTNEIPITQISQVIF